MKFVVIADYFVEQILGGGELNNHQLISILEQKGFEVNKIQSHQVTLGFLKVNHASCFIISNFINLLEEIKEEIMKLNYIIYEHDHKYLKTRNPASYKNFIAPPGEIINYEFYKKAKAVLCQSTFHADMVKSNLHLDNIVSVGGNLWSLGSLRILRVLAAKSKQEQAAVMNSPIDHKNTREALRYCEFKKIPYLLIASRSYEEFLSLLGSCNKFVFFPKTPETLSRVIVEARMMGLSIITNKNVGATQEEWYKLKGLPLIDYVEKMRDSIPEIVIGVFKK